MDVHAENKAKVNTFKNQMAYCVELGRIMYPLLKVLSVKNNY